MDFDQAELTYLSISRYSGTEAAPRNSSCDENGFFDGIPTCEAYLNNQ